LAQNTAAFLGQMSFAHTILKYGDKAWLTKPLPAKNSKKAGRASFFRRGGGEKAAP
jgi:hypothetical protein